MAPNLDDLTVTAFAAAVLLRAPRIPVLSNVHGTLICSHNTLLSTSTSRRMPVRSCSSRMASAARLHRLCAPHARLRAPPALDVPLDALCGCRAARTGLYISSVADDWHAVFADAAPAAHLTDLPAHPFAQTCFWVPYYMKPGPRN
ncbi:hypothetical protein PsYK624_023180 [Phanerochaete sordida]|uniref:Uncharacterized protein n=1 Tax=Phanerochaete sordida TaxID=48140 RepID=A0A9P3FZQ0_9APHY|nr:hypothetical protein PsYK624_023180 [Phanerochaete sordida]